MKGGFARKASKKKESVISSVKDKHDKEAEDHANKNECKCEVYDSIICLFVCLSFFLL